MAQSCQSAPPQLMTTELCCTRDAGQQTSEMNLVQPRPPVAEAVWTVPESSVSTSSAKASGPESRSPDVRADDKEVVDRDVETVDGDVERTVDRDVEETVNDDVSTPHPTAFDRDVEGADHDATTPHPTGSLTSVGTDAAEAEFQANVKNYVSRVIQMSLDVVETVDDDVSTPHPTAFDHDVEEAVDRDVDETADHDAPTPHPTASWTSIGTDAAEAEFQAKVKNYVSMVIQLSRDVVETVDDDVPTPHPTAFDRDVEEAVDRDVDKTADHDAPTPHPTASWTSIGTDAAEAEFQAKVKNYVSTVIQLSRILAEAGPATDADKPHSDVMTHVETLQVDFNRKPTNVTFSDVIDVDAAKQVVCWLAKPKRIFILCVDVHYHNVCATSKAVASIT